MRGDESPTIRIGLVDANKQQDFMLDQQYPEEVFLKTKRPNTW